MFCVDGTVETKHLLQLGIEESVQARGYQVMMSTTRSDPQIEQSYIEFLYNKSIDGIIFFNSEQTPEAIDRLSKKYPITFCISSLEGAKASAVTIDNVRAAYDAVSSLIQAGHRKIALVYEPEASMESSGARATKGR